MSATRPLDRLADAGRASPTVLWFRRDLRVHDHPALAEAIAGGGPVAPLFVLDDALLRGRWRSANREWFLRGSVAALAGELSARGAPLIVVRGDPVEAVVAHARRVGAGRVVASRDYAPYGRRRDERVRARLTAAGIGWVTTPGQLIQEPEDVATRDGRPYRVFGPFRRAWAGLAWRPVLPAPARIRGLEQATGNRARAAAAGKAPDLDPDAPLAEVKPTADPALLPAPGEAAARQRLERWAGSAALETYADDRDRLDLDGTSRLSADLRFGLLSPVEIAERCAGPDAGRRRYLDELAWREFYAHLLWHQPRLAREASRIELDRVAWNDDPALVDAWRDGRTGFPVVDAAMRQLRQAGWMPNRARMITAMFLTKDLGVDWRVGERHFMEHLVDGDPASNNGGWQWAASTGSDPQPWFRVFNPVLQGRRHDPDGAYVRHWLPELAGVGGADAHEPGALGYAAPLVDHDEARTLALRSYSEAARSG